MKIVKLLKLSYKVLIQISIQELKIWFVHVLKNSIHIVLLYAI